MKKITILHLLIFLFYSVCAQENKAVSGTVDFISPELYKLINKESKVEVIAEGFQFTEGPVWVEKDQMLLFSDVPGNTIYKWTAGAGKELYLPQAGYTDSVKTRRIYGVQWIDYFQ